jgi:lantibiotic modifying enzyme
MDVRLECIHPKALDAKLYSGRGGMAIAFEKAYRVLGDARWLDLARRSLMLELQGWQRGGGGRERIARERPTGMLARGGLVAGLWAVGRHEGQGAFRDAARGIATEITDRTIRSDDDYDLISGSAGYILLLLHLNEEELIPGLPDLIARLADHLVRNVVDVDGPGWRGSAQRLPLCGFAHGRAGIALALLEAGRFLGRSDLHDLALAVFDAEHRLRGKTPADGWPDFRSVDVQTRGSARRGSIQWCSGTEGIALSRAAALMIDDAPVLRDDLAFAIESICDLQKPGRGHLCCGTTGRPLTHQTLARLTSEISLDLDQAASIVATALERGQRGEGGLMGVGLLQGAAGPVWAGLSLLDDDGSDLLLLRP